MNTDFAPWLILLLLLSTVPSVYVLWQRWKKRRGDGPQPKQPLQPGQEHLEAYSLIHSMVEALDESACVQALDSYFDHLLRKTALLDGEAPRLRLMLEQTASRLSLVRWVPGRGHSQKGSVIALDKAHRAFWDGWRRLLERSDLTPLWKSLIDESWEDQIVDHMVRALHLFANARQEPLRDLHGGLSTLAAVSPEMAGKTGLDRFLAELPVGGDSRKISMEAFAARLSILGQGFPPRFREELTRTLHRAGEEDRLLKRIVESGSLELARRELCGNPDADTCLLPIAPANGGEPPLIALFTNEPEDGPSVIRARFKGFNLALGVRRTKESCEFLVTNRNTEDVNATLLSDETVAQLETLTGTKERRFLFAIVETSRPRILHARQNEASLDPTGRMQAILDSIGGGRFAEALAAAESPPVDEDRRLYAWLELLIHHCSSLHDHELPGIRESLLQALGAEPDHWRFLSALGMLYKREGNDEKALECFSRSYRLFPYDLNNLLCLAKLLLSAPGRRNDDLIRHLAALACDLNPESGAVVVFLRELEEAGVSSVRHLLLYPIDPSIQ